VIPYSRQNIDDADVAAVEAVLRGEFLTTGPTVTAFEDALAELVDARHVVSFSSGTAALHGAMAAAGIGPGDTVCTSSLSFVASANCARYVGADVAFVDIDPATLNLDVASVPECDALVAVHFAGLPVALDGVPQRPRLVIEDAAHALGSSRSGRPVGACVESDMTVFSFHPVKSITTAEGGAVATNDDSLADELRQFRNHGMRARPDIAPWYYEVVGLGMNYRLSDVHAGLGLSQLRRLGDFVRARTELAERYDAMLADLDVVPPPGPPAGDTHARHLYPVRTPRRAELYQRLRSAGFGAQVHYIPIHHHPAFRGAHHLPATDQAYEQLLSLPLHPSLTYADQDAIVAVLRETLGPRR